MAVGADGLADFEVAGLEGIAHGDVTVGVGGDDGALVRAQKEVVSECLLQVECAIVVGVVEVGAPWL